MFVKLLHDNSITPPLDFLEISLLKIKMVIVFNFERINVC